MVSLAVPGGWVDTCWHPERGKEGGCVSLLVDWTESNQPRYDKKRGDPTTSTRIVMPCSRTTKDSKRKTYICWKHQLENDAALREEAEVAATATATAAAALPFEAATAAAAAALPFEAAAAAAAAATTTRAEATVVVSPPPPRSPQRSPVLWAVMDPLMAAASGGAAVLNMVASPIANRLFSSPNRCGACGNLSSPHHIFSHINVAISGPFICSLLIVLCPHAYPTSRPLSTGGVRRQAQPQQQQLPRPHVVVLS